MVLHMDGVKTISSLAIHTRYALMRCGFNNCEHVLTETTLGLSTLGVVFIYLGVAGMKY